MNLFHRIFMYNKLQKEIDYLEWHYYKSLKNFKSKTSKGFKDANKIV